MKIKVKNVTNKEKKLKTLNGESMVILPGKEKIVGDYSSESRLYIFNLLKDGFEVSKIEDNHMIETDISSEGSRKSSETNLKNSNNDNCQIEEKPKKKRGRPRKVK